ncbi:DUF6301 family protein [Nocardia niigatensis]|uniref:DUF6301 family protein n=1 Tax=Nocardia niigatensis TaxID=209249 RepID=UPI00059299E1|nr:DUF6301 family protein [Nocardia niigatensis]
MTEWRVLPGPEVGKLAVRLASLDWSWSLTDVPALAEDFGWTVRRSYRSSVSLDGELGPDSANVSGRSGTANKIEVRVTNYADDDSSGRARVRDAFADMTSAVTAALGAPTLRSPGEYAETRWAGTQTTVRLREFKNSVSLYLYANEALALEDQATAMDEQGLL